MKRLLGHILLVVGALAAFAGPAASLAKEKPGPSVTFAKSWDAAVEEAKLLNLPLVVHSHGFY